MDPNYSESMDKPAINPAVMAERNPFQSFSFGENLKNLDWIYKFVTKIRAIEVLASPFRRIHSIRMYHGFWKRITKFNFSKVGTHCVGLYLRFFFNASSNKLDKFGHWMDLFFSSSSAHYYGLFHSIFLRSFIHSKALIVDIIQFPFLRVLRCAYVLFQALSSKHSAV